ncbi:Leucine-rich repeat serine/threonine-protein kinase 1, partial [Hondaea fermentalgiana]
QSLFSAATGGRLSASKSPVRLEAAAATAPPVPESPSPKALVDEEELTRKFALRDEDQAVLQGAAQAEARDVSFSIWDYGGQKVFYALHHIFLTDKGLYLV